MIRFRRKKIQAGEPDLKKDRRKCAFDAETEEHLTNVLPSSAAMGSAPR